MITFFCPQDTSFLTQQLPNGTTYALKFGMNQEAYMLYLALGMAKFSCHGAEALLLLL